jgi:Co/Zn/Cd efflux system component
MAQGSSKAVGCGCGAEQAAELQRRTLWVVLVINAAMFVVELAVGLRAGSTGLIADSLDCWPTRASMASALKPWAAT